MAVLTREGDVEGNGAAEEAAYDLLAAALSAKINLRLERRDDVVAHAEQAGAAIVALLAALGASRRRTRR